MSDQAPPNVKVFDRPDPKGPSPVMLAVFVLIALAVGIFGYRAFFMRPAAVPAAPASRTSRAVLQQYLPAVTSRNFVRASLAQV